MRILVAGMMVLGVAITGSDPGISLAGGPLAVEPVTDFSSMRPASSERAPHPAPETLTTLVRTYCVVCHNDVLLTGNTTLQAFEVENATDNAQTAERMIMKLRAGMMPPPGFPRPGGDSLVALVETLESTLDEAAARNPNPGNRTFQRLNRAEYEASVESLLGLRVDAGLYLPLDTKSANFDNIADVQLLSPTLMDAYLNAAAEISRLAVGNLEVQPSETTYSKSGYFSQWERIDGAPFGTRGGISALHNFPADGEYSVKMAFDHTTTGEFFGNVTQGEQIEISIDGERVALLNVDQFMHVADPNGANQESQSFFVTAGPHQVSAVFLKQFEGPVPDLMSRHDWSLADRRIGADGYGITALPHIKDLTIAGPFQVTGVSENPVRRRIFSCRPTAPEEAEACARDIVTRLGSTAFRRSLTELDVSELMEFYRQGEDAGGFETGVRLALQAILASPDFVFRFEPVAGSPRDGSYRISELALASRLSYFLWGTPPDEELVSLAERGRLSDNLRDQVERMIADPRSDALGTRFANQWLRLQDLDLVHPDRLMFPDYHQQLADAMTRETELLFMNLVREDRSFLELYTADYTFVNERLAKHYGIPGVVGEEFQRVEYPDDRRAGIFGHGSVLTLTSVANRTSPVLRGKWVMEVVLGTPPPPPPPGVPDLEETEAVEGTTILTTRERMERHRASPVCNACHQFMDPIGLALDNFDVTGKWRIREHGIPLDTRGTFYDGSDVTTPQELRAVLLERPEPLIRHFTANLMAYALGRRMEYYDQPEIREIARKAATEGNRMSAFIRGVVESEAFQMKSATAVEDAQSGG
ncbi:MAG: DUF1592 domain-containing protein [Gammaproteobacteria bacterium]|nr:DUF1592 domain-containing protein [Gammaproteobacteria bacterium]MYF61012.1 DUF1592 domain-containing protein [Gammaproteobacteria bacterium]MYI21422.1 DUF1592 domain-containing protein [Gammaproteobacteria bacterium]